MFGLGYTYIDAQGNSRDMSKLFIDQSVACLGYAEHEAPPIWQDFRRLRIGDFGYLKSHPRGNLLIRAVGYVTDAAIVHYGDVLGWGVKMRWLWHGTPVAVPYTPEEQKYNVRSIVFYNEPSIMVQSAVVALANQVGSPFHMPNGQSIPRLCEHCHMPKNRPSPLSRVPTGQREPAGSPAAKHAILCPGDQYGAHAA
jgi:hypothetical protein